MSQLAWTITATTALLLTPAAVFLFSRDAGRRTRAWRLINLLFRR